MINRNTFIKTNYIYLTAFALIAIILFGIIYIEYNTNLIYTDEIAFMNIGRDVLKLILASEITILIILLKVLFQKA